MDYKEIIVFSLSLLNIYGAISYIKGMILGENKPNKVTWGIWASANLIGTGIAFSSGITWAILPVFTSGISSGSIFLASFLIKGSYWKLEKFDYICLFLAGISLIFWIFAREPTLAIIFAILVDLIALIPTFKKVWSYPETEGVAPYIVGIITNLSSFLIIKTVLPVEYLFQLYIIISNIFVVFMIYRSKIFNKKNYE